MPTATIQMKNSAIDRTSEIFSADHVSMWRSCSLARRGPRPLCRAGPRPRTPLLAAGAPLSAAASRLPASAAVEEPVTGGTRGAPTGPPVGGTTVAPAEGAPMDVAPADGPADVA